MGRTLNVMYRVIELLVSYIMICTIMYYVVHVCVRKKDARRDEERKWRRILAAQYDEIKDLVLAVL